MNRFKLLVALSLIIMLPLSAQEKSLTLHDLIPGGKSYYRFVPKNLSQLKWLGDEYIYQKGDSIWAVNPAKKRKERTLFTREQLNRSLAEKGVKTVGGIPGIATFRDKAGSDKIYFYAHRSIFFYDPQSTEITDSISYLPGDGNLDLSVTGKRLAMTVGKALYVVDSNGKRTCVASDANPNISFGANNVHRNEFGISKGTFWSPQGDALAFYKMDETNVESYPLVDVSARQAKLNEIKYPMAGMRSHQVNVGVYSVAQDRVIYLQTGAPREQYQTNISWSPGGKEIYIAELNRQQDTLQLKAYNSETGALARTLFTETHSKYVEPESPLFFINDNPDEFIWQSERDGYNHLYLYTKEGKLIRQLTQGDWMVTEIIGTDAKGKTLYFTSTEESPLESHTYALDLKSGKHTRLTADSGMHYTQLNASKTFMIDNYSNHNTPRNIEVVNLKNGKADRLLTAADPFKNYTMPTTTVGTIKAADGVTDLYYRLTTPVGFDPSKTYPVVVYVYGGPHAQLITNSWRWALGGWDAYMAQQGYVMFTLDNRGSSRRGLDFENVIHRQLGVEEMKDQVKGIEWLKSQGFVDESRIGVCGWSYGGFMTSNLLLTHPDIYKVGVAGGPVMDWKYYEVMYGERYMDNPKENPEGYKNSSLLNKAGNLQGRLLIIHGDKDPVVVWQHSLAFLKQCVTDGTYPDYYVYPGHEHNVIGPDRVHLQEKITRYFNDYLK